MYVIVKRDGKTIKVISGTLDTRSGAEALLEIYKSKMEQNGVTYYVKETTKGKK